MSEAVEAVAPEAAEVAATEAPAVEDISDAALLARVHSELGAPAEPAAEEAPSAETAPEAGATTGAPDEAALAAAREEARNAEFVAKQLEVHRAREREKAEFEALKRELAEQKAWRQRLKEDTLSALQEDGVDAQALTEMMVGDKNPERVLLRQALAEIKSLKADREAERERSKTMSAEEQAARSIAGYKAERVAKPLAAKRAELKHLFAIHGEAGVTELVYGEMDRVWRERGQELNAADVARDLEAQAQKRYKEIRDQVEATQSAPKPAAVTTPKPKPKTLNNGMTQAAPPPEPEDEDISDEALMRKARASVAAMTD